MSGQKVSYVNITDREYERFMNSAREVENIESKVSKQLKKQESKMRNEFDSQLNTIKIRNQQQKNMIQNLSSTMRSMEKDFQNNLNRLDNKINRVNYKLDTLIKDIENKEESKKSQAKEWYKNASDSLDIVDTYNHNKFLPNRYEELQQKLNLSKSNIENEVYESSISQSQTVWQDAFKLRLELEELENEWNEYLKNAIESNNRLLATCDAQKTLELAFDTEDGDTTLEVDIDHWCKGELTTLKNKALDQQKILKNSKVMGVDDFKKLINESSTLEKEVLSLTQKSKDAIILSQLRSDMASDIVESLDDSGFELVESCFKSDDEREAIHLKMQNISGDEVVTIITPMENKKNKLDIHFFDDSDENFKQTRLQSMIERLADSGVECTKPKCAEGTKYNNIGDERVRDFEKIKTFQRG